MFFKFLKSFLTFLWSLLAKPKVPVVPPLHMTIGSNYFKTVAIDTPGGNLSLKIKSRAQQITLNPNIIKVKNLLANVSLFTIQHLQSNLNEFTG